MMLWKSRWALSGALLVVVGVVGCNGTSADSDGGGGEPSDSDSDGTGGKKATGGKSSGGGSSSGGKAATGGASTGNGGASTGGLGGDATGGLGGDDTGGTGGTAAGGTGSGGEGTGGDGTGGAAPTFPSLPTVLSVSGCEAINLGPLCSVEQEDGIFTANCGGIMLGGEIDSVGEIDLSSEPMAIEGGSQTIDCIGEFRYGRLRATSCVRTTTPTEGAPTEETCSWVSDPQVQPGLSCADLPASFEDLTICVEGAASEGQTITAGDCSVIQDGCNYQAECENGLLLKGTVSATGISFNQELIALADAQTPSSGGSPAFLKGAVVRHSCSLAVNGTTVSGSCGAGSSGRGGTNTSLCSIGGSADGVSPTCELVAPAAEHVLVLDSCEALKEGEGANPGIGEPVCAVRQNNCVWEVQCGRALKFEGVLEPGGTKLNWTLPTGTPCEISFDESGEMTGKCQVPEQPACNLSSKEASPGGDECAALPDETVQTRGCGDGQGTGLSCSALVQHGCNFVGTCNFRGINAVIAGEIADDGAEGRSRVEFSGVNGYQCYAEEANASDIANDARVAGEWFGDCESASGGVCRNNYNVDTNPTGLRGLQLFFAQPEPPVP